MKTLINKAGLVILFIFIMGAGCEKNIQEGEYSEIEFLKFSDFGCQSDNSWYLNTGCGGGNYIITSLQDFEKCVTIECNPEVNFSSFFVLVGSKQFSSGVSIYNEKVEENNLEVVYTITFLPDDSDIAQKIKYYVIIKKPSQNKNIRIVEVIKENV
jgi:hypothetical protein